MKVDVSGIPSPKNKEKVFHQNGKTQDIVEVILETDKEDDPRFCKFAEQFRGKLDELWRFVKHKIKYQRDGFGRQDIKTPAALWDIGEGDCKSKTLFVNQVLRCLGIAYKTRFTTYTKGADFTHVYTVYKDPKTGVWTPLDTVWNRPKSEKRYSSKKDYPGYMTRIAQISGLSRSVTSGATMDLRAEVQKARKDVLQKQQYVSQQKPLALRNLSVGDANLAIMRRQLELLKTFNQDDKSKAALYSKAITMVDKAIALGAQEAGKAISGMGAIADPLQGVAAVISAQSRKMRPAMNPIAGAIAGLSSSANTVVPGWDMIVRNNQDLYNSYYAFGAGTSYQKKWADVYPHAVDWINAQWAEALRLQHVRGSNVNMPALGYANMRANTVFFRDRTNPLMVQGLNSNPRSAMFAPNTAMGSSANPFAMQFASGAFQREFEKYVEQKSGIWDEYLQNVAFAEQGQVGAALIYSFADHVSVNGRRLGLNDYPQAIAAKSVPQNGWLGAASFFSGTDSEVLLNLSRNTYVYGAGETPETTLKSLLDQTGGIGEPLTIAAIASIVAALAPIIAAALSSMGNSRQEAEVLKPNNVPQTFVPLQGSQALEEADWTDYVRQQEQAGTPVDSGTASALGLDSKTLGLGLLGIAAGYYFYNQDKN